VVVAAPIIVTAQLGRADFAWLDSLRRAHYPPERNQVAAHLTLFRHLPPSCAGELKRRLASEARDMSKPEARLDKVLLFEQGVGFRLHSPALEAMRARLAQAFDRLLTPQDSAPWRGHITIQNKVAPIQARVLYDQLKQDFEPRRLELTGLECFYYRGGPWEPLAAFKFKG
jgi:2'-5' RNA ligase